MKVSEMIEKLHQFPKDMEVEITDGFGYKFYKGNFEFRLFEEMDGRKIVDIGIGGYDYE